MRNYKLFLGVLAVVFMTAMMLTVAVNAQTYPANTTTDPANTTAVPGNTTTPGVPNTGAGGNAYTTVILLLASASLVVMGAISLRQLSRDASIK